MFRRILLASLSRRRKRLTLSLLAVTVGIAVATALGTLALRVGDDLARTLREAGPNFVILPAGTRLANPAGGAGLDAPRAAAGLPDSVVASLKRSYWRNNILDAAPERSLGARLERGADSFPLRVQGTWFERTLRTDDGTWTTGFARLHSAWPRTGPWPREDAAEIAVGAGLAKERGLAPGQWVVLRSGAAEERLLVTAVVEAGGPEDQQAWVPLAVARRLDPDEPGVDRVWLSALVRPAPHRPAPDPARDPKGYERYMCAAFPEHVASELAGRMPGCEVLPASEVMAGEARVVGRLNLLMSLLALAALTASTLGLLSTTTATVVERRVEIGLLRALGADARQVAALLLAETLLVAVFGGILGWVLGSLAAAAIRGDAFGSGGSFMPLLLPAAVVIALAVALLGTVVPLRIATSIEPAGALRG